MLALTNSDLLHSACCYDNKASELALGLARLFSRDSSCSNKCDSGGCWIVMSQDSALVFYCLGKLLHCGRFPKTREHGADKALGCTAEAT